MKTEAPRIVSNTAKTLSAVHSVFSVNATVRDNDWMLLLAITPPILAAYAATEVGAWVIHEIGRQIRIHEKRPASPSLRGTPTPKELVADWREEPRTLATRLRLGSRLADLDSTLDHTLLRTTLPNGKTVIRSRKGGMKGWLEDRRVAIPYSTAMRYKKLAQRLRQILQLDDRIPLEWLMSGIPAGQHFPTELQSAFGSAARRLGAILRENPTLVALGRYAERKLGIVRLVSVRKMEGGRMWKHGKTSDFSVISRMRRANVSPERVEATKEAMGRVLVARNLAGGALHLQNRIKAWLSGLKAMGRP
ncbi:MAG: hypothetical protein IKQ55_05085 [Kiritimatiellae bacterium]|nr:hypothetical protein [Kiritimatiellia bacterium]